MWGMWRGKKRIPRVHSTTHVAAKSIILCPGVNNSSRPPLYFRRSSQNTRSMSTISRALPKTISSPVISGRWRLIVTMRGETRHFHSVSLKCFRINSPHLHTDSKVNARIEYSVGKRVKKKVKDRAKFEKNPNLFIRVHTFKLFYI